MMRRTFLTSALDMPEIMSYIYSKSWKLQFSASSSIIIIEDYYLQTFLHSLIFTMDNIKIFMSRPTLFDIPDDAKIRFNDSDIVIGGRGYNAWLKGWEEIDFETVSNVAVREIQQVIQQIILCMR